MNSTSHFSPHVTVAAIIERDNRFLMVSEIINTKLVINQPAGHLDDHETLIEACVREVLEETGAVVQVQFVTGIYLFKAHQDLTFLRICFAADFIEQTNKELDKDIEQALWLDYQQIQQHHKYGRLRSALVLSCLDDYLAGNQYPLAIIKPLIGY